MEWTWSWTPGFDAQFGDNPVADWVRVGCVVLGMVLLCVTGRILLEARRRPEPMPLTQKARFVAFALAVVSLSMTEVAVVGTPATPRLVTSIVIILLGIYGVHGMRHKQRRTPTKESLS